jgi:mannosyltransferase
VTRYLLIVVAPAAIVAAAGLERLGPRASVDSTAVRLLAVCALFAVAAAPGQLAVRGRTAKNGSDYRAAAALVHRYRQPGDDIVYTPGSRTLRAGINYYLRHDPGRPRDVLLVRSAAAAGSLRATESADPVTRIGGAKRIWVLLAGVQDDPTTVRGDLTPLLRGEYRRIQLWHVKRATLALFIRRDPAVH